METNKKKKSRLFSTLIIIAIIFFAIVWLFSDDEDTAPIINSSTDKYTLMIYMCGSDLESEEGYASSDIEEMLESQLAKEVNLLIYTGGTKLWENNNISSDRNQIFKVENNELTLVRDDIGMKYFSRPDTLTEFLNWSKENYPADRYGLILWDHGGGAVSGFGFDENEPDENESLTIDEIKTALDNFEPKLDFIGFDACVMANFETAYAFKDNSKYFIGSEESEPGTGWEYKKLLNQLSRNTSQEAPELGKIIVDSFIDSNDGIIFGDEATLSIMDLSKMDSLYTDVLSFMKDIKSQKFDINDYTSVAKALKNAKAFAEGEIDTFDLMDFSSKLAVNSSDKLNNSIKECVVYNNTTTDVEDSNGISIYFPNKDLDNYEKMIPIYRNIGFSDEYINIMNEYVNIISGGNKRSYTVNHNTYQTDEYYENYGWYDNDFINEYSYYYDENDLDVNELEVQKKDDTFILHLTDEQWEKIIDIGSSIWYDDGEGYVDLGIDSYYEMDDDGNLKVEFDGNWIAINENIVNYTVVEKNDKSEKGKVHAYLNDEEVYLIICWDEKYPEGQVIGYEPVDEYGDTTLIGKGYGKIKKGDKIEFVFDYYGYDGEYEDTYIFGDEIIVDDSGLKVSYEWVGDGECIVYYVLTDLFNNIYYTEPIVVY